MRHSIILALLMAGCALPRGEKGDQGLSGASGRSCTVKPVENGSLITCDDGTSSDVSDGKDGLDEPESTPESGKCITYKKCNDRDKKKDDKEECHKIEVCLI